ncbi:MAG: NAD-dependent epimerase [Pseudomonadota bacterium]
MQILVTGAAGFVGAHVCKALLAEGHTVVGLDNFNDYYDVQLKEDRVEALCTGDGFSMVNMDLADRPDMQSLFAEYTFDRVIHLGAQAGVRYSLENPHAYGQANLTGFLNVLEGCRQHQVGHLVFASSSSVYGANETQPFSSHHSTEHPFSLYAATKKANEMMAHSYAHLYRLPITGLRFFTVYGPWGRPDMAYFSFTRKIMAGETIDVFNNGQHARDFTYIDDVVEGVIRVMDHIAAPNPHWDTKNPDPASSSAPYRLFNIGNSQPVELMSFIRTIEDAVGKPAALNFLPMQPGDVHRTSADVSDLQQAVGFSPNTPLADGIQRFVDWYKAYKR